MLRERERECVVLNLNLPGDTCCFKKSFLKVVKSDEWAPAGIREPNLTKRLSKGRGARHPPRDRGAGRVARGVAPISKTNREMIRERGTRERERRDREIRMMVIDIHRRRKEKMVDHRIRGQKPV
jgi:hypothetical protein